MRQNKILSACFADDARECSIASQARADSSPNGLKHAGGARVMNARKPGVAECALRYHRRIAIDQIDDTVGKPSFLQKLQCEMGRQHSLVGRLP